VDIISVGPTTIIVQASSSPIWLTLITAVIGGGIVGSIVSTFLSTGKDGRESRAKARECLSRVEDARWEDTEYREFRKLLSEFESSALIARTPQDLVKRYTYLAELGRREALRAHENLPNTNRALPVDLSSLIDACVIIIVHYLWRPRWQSIRSKRSVWVIDRGITITEKDKPEYNWNVGWRPLAQTKEPGIKGWWHRRKDGKEKDGQPKSIE
jgi:hypothetical protein